MLTTPVLAQQPPGPPPPRRDDRRRRRSSVRPIGRGLRWRRSRARRHRGKRSGRTPRSMSAVMQKLKGAGMPPDAIRTPLSTCSRSSTTRTTGRRSGLRRAEHDRGAGRRSAETGRRDRHRGRRGCDERQRRAIRPQGPGRAEREALQHGRRRRPSARGRRGCGRRREGRARAEDRGTAQIGGGRRDR